MDPLMERGMEDPPLPKYELAVTWYELILSPEKFHLHLKKLSEDNNGEKNVYKSILFSAHNQVCNFIFMHMCLCMYVIPTARLFMHFIHFACKLFIVHSL